MGWYYVYKKLKKEFDKIYVGIFIFGTFSALLFVSFFHDEETRPTFIARQNEKWKFGNKLGVTRDVLNMDSILLKNYEGNFGIKRRSVSKEIEYALNSKSKGVILKTIQQQDKLSLVKDFICGGSASEYNALCGRILFHHGCSFDDSSSRDPEAMIKNFAKELTLLSKEIGWYMYFDLNIEEYDCKISKSNVSCLYDLIIDPLEKISKDSSDVYLIVVNFIEDCRKRGDTHNLTIFQILSYLAKKLPPQFKFIIVTRGWMNINILDKQFGFLTLLDMQKGFKTGKSGFVTYQNGELFPCLDMRIGHCVDSIEIMLLIVMLGSMYVVELGPMYKYPYIVLIYSAFIKSTVIFASLMSWIIMVFLCYLYFKDIKPKPENEHKDWFHRLNLVCDNVHIHCIIDQRLERKYVQLKRVYQKESLAESFVDSTLTRKSIKGLKISVLSEFEMSYLIKSIGSGNNESMISNLINASQRKYSILCRWLMLNHRYNEPMNNAMERALDIAFDNEDKHVAKAVAWTVVKSFVQIFKRNLSDVHDIYPALKCKCKGKKDTRHWLCSTTKIIVLISDGPPSRFKGIPRRFKGFTTYNKFEKKNESEEEAISNIFNKKKHNSVSLRNNIPSTFVEKLFKNHSNLSLICTSPCRSLLFGSSKHTIKDEICVQLYCLSKGLIPIGEEHFPITIHDIPTDVLEGRAFFLSNLHIGERIGTITSTGTLGGFVHYLSFKCLLTCAHVMYDSQTLLNSSRKFTELAGSTAYSHATQVPTEIGNVIWRAFEHGDKFKTSIDAALVLLQNNATIDANDYILDRAGNPCHFSRLGLNSLFINENFVDPEDICGRSQQSTLVAAGARTKLEESGIFPKRSEVEVLFDDLGHTSAQVNGNNFFPLVINSPAHTRLLVGQLGQHRRTFVMYNQIVIPRLNLQQGDSGTCLYIVQHPENKNGCIGMAIAFCAGVSVVTPIKDILQRINS